MSKNALYNVINAEIASQLTNIPGAESLFQLTHRLGSKYFLFKLPFEDNMRVGDFTLIEHHLSVYDKPLGKLDLKSQTHYTACFKDASYNVYRLHVYFDSNDDLVGRPLLSKLVSDDIYEPVNCQENEEVFLVSARFSTKALFGYLREVQNRLINTHQEEYDVLEKEASLLSQNLVKNKEEYLYKVGRLIETLDQIINYSNSTQIPLGKRTFLVRLRKSVERLEVTAPVVKSEKLKARGKSEKSKARLKGEIEVKSPLALHSNSFFPANLSSSGKPNKSRSKLEISEAINALSLDFEKCKRLEDKALIRSIEALYSELREKEVGIDFEYYTASTKDIQELQTLKKGIETLAKGLLQKLLITGKYEEAKKLNLFYSILPNDIIQLALLLNKANLLNFLIENQIVNINYKYFTIKGVKYSSLVDYCFKESTNKQSKADCLAVLVQHGASLMELDSSNGLPFAATLLLQPDHPLNKVLKSTTINNPLFYMQLNQVLLVVRLSCTEELREQINILIETNRKKIGALNFYTALGGSSTIKLVEEFSSQDRESLCEGLVEELVEKFQSDQDINAMNSRVAQRVSEFLVQLPKKEQSAVSREFKTRFAAATDISILRKALTTIKDLDLLPPFEDVKSQTLGRLLTVLSIVDRREELIEVQRTIKSIPPRGAKPSREQKRLYLRQKELLQELKMLGKSLEQEQDIPELMKTFEQSIDLVKSLGNIFNDNFFDSDLFAMALSESSGLDEAFVKTMFKSLASQLTSLNEEEKEEEIECKMQ